MTQSPSMEDFDLEKLIFESSRVIASASTAQRILSMLEPTSLTGDETLDEIEELCQKASSPVGNAAAVCVLPRFAETAFNALRHNTVKIATVINFPDGDDEIDDITNMTEDVVNAGAQEIDIVMPYKAFLDQNYDHVRDVLTACRNACGNQVLMKVILEIGALGTHDRIMEATHLAIACGADFIKTSTGKFKTGASLEGAAAILMALYDHATKNVEAPRVGFKVAGGLKNANEAAQYLKLTEAMMGEGWADDHTMRFGASKLFDEILETIGDIDKSDDEIEEDKD